MKNPLLILAFAAISVFSVQAQQAHCGFDEHLNRMLEADPSGIQIILEHQAQAQELTRQRIAGERTERGGGPRIIPTVFHVIHQGGSENISYEQIEDQVRILNEDFRRQNADASNTRAEFLPVVADANVEFRLAKLDPQGNCTDGVVRKWSHLTNNATDAVKAVSYWNSTKYFNVWVVSTIDANGEPGTILGYAQFPGFGGASTDGVVVRADYVGDIGTGASNGSKGRTLTHEAGHWLGLFHTFQGGCTGGFFGEGVDDTPPIAEATSSNCPHNANTCSNDSPDLHDMVENYMDYSNGACQNTYTLGQKDVMDATLAGSRSQLHSASNLAFTGVDNPSATPCQAYADFYAEELLVCVGNDITFTDNSFNGQVATYNWQFTGASPSASSDANPTVFYNAQGLYSVSLTVTNPQGTDSQTKTDYINVISDGVQVPGAFSFEGFEETQEDYIILSDGAGNTWEETNTAYTGSKGLYIKNFSGNPVGSIDEMLLPSVDLTQMTEPKVYFKLSYKERSGAADRLKLYASRNCGENWSVRYQKTGSSLATVSGTQGSPFTPSSASDWESVEVNLSAFANDEHVLIKFQSTSDEGNNIYLDDIQISGTLAVNENTTAIGFNVSPNPTVGDARISFHVKEAGRFQVSLMDVTGKLLTTLYNGQLNTGKQSFVVNRTQLNSAGIYLMQVEHSGGKSVQKLVVQ